MRIILSAGEGPASRAYRRRVVAVAVVGLLAVLLGILAQFSQATSAPSRGRPHGTPGDAPAVRVQPRHETLPVGLFTPPDTPRY